MPMKVWEQGELFTFFDHNRKYWSIVKEVTLLSTALGTKLVKFQVLTAENLPARGCTGLPYAVYDVGETYAVSPSWLDERIKAKSLELI
jgi:hypothetical protein